MIAKRFSELITTLFPDGFQQAISDIGDQLPPDMVQYLELVSQLTQEHSLDAIVKLLEEIGMEDPVRLHPALFRYYHQSVTGTITADDVWPVAAYRNLSFKPMHRLEFIEGPYSGSDMPVTQFYPDIQSPEREIGYLYEIAEIPANVLVNSRNLARALNQLSNAESETDDYAPVAFSFRGQETVLETPADLIRALCAEDDLEIVGYEARYGVDFPWFALNENGDYTTVEFPSWLCTNLPGAPALPTNHCEQLFVVYKKGETRPLASVRWFMALPLDKELNQGSSWKGHIYRLPSWSGYKITHVHTGAERLSRIAWAERHIMKAYNCIQDHHSFPHHGYGILAVCVDSVSLISIHLGEDPGLSHWPNLRTIEFDPLYHEVLSHMPGSLSLITGNVLNVPADVYPELYLNATYISQNARRLVRNIPFRSRGEVRGRTYQYVFERFSGVCPDFPSELNAIISY